MAERKKAVKNSQNRYKRILKVCNYRRKKPKRDTIICDSRTASHKEPGIPESYIYITQFYENYKNVKQLTG